VGSVSSLRLDEPLPLVIQQVEAWLSAGDPAPVVIETSGSTGRPKRVLLSRDAVVASARMTAARLEAEGRWLLALPVTHVAGFQAVVRSLLADQQPTPVEGHLAAALGRRGDTAMISLVPTQLHRLLAEPAEVAALRRMHSILVGGGPVAPRLRALATAESLRVIGTYGATETCGGCVYDGAALPGAECAVGEDGRIQLRGPMLCDGYLDDPGLTREVLRDGWFRSSDVGEFDSDGRLRVLGRLDDVVISGGVKVPTHTVATRLRAHPDVFEAEVVGVPDHEWGDRVVAYVVGSLSLVEARAWVGELYPRAWAPREIVTLEALPTLAGGKVDRSALRQRALGGIQ
jgi:o-succinylbenzoate---CoA ligase